MAHRLVDIIPKSAMPAHDRRMRKLVAEQMREHGTIGRSASGNTLKMAVDWCYETETPFELYVDPKLGATIKTVDRN